MALIYAESVRWGMQFALQHRLPSPGGLRNALFTMAGFEENSARFGRLVSCVGMRPAA
jgi:hypothetical protein